MSSAPELSVRADSASRISARSGTAAVLAVPARRSAGLAHELREPVQSALALLQSLLRTGKIEVGGQGDALLAVNQLARVQTLINAYAHAAAVDLRPPQLRPLDLAAVAQEAALLLASAASEGTRIELKQNDRLLPVFGDGAQLAQAVSTLILAVQESAGHHARLLVQTGREASRDGSTRVWLAVGHTQAPLAPEERENLFVPDALQNDGSSLGLYIVKRILEAHGGEVRVESPRADTGNGLRLTLLLPELIEYQI